MRMNQTGGGVIDDPLTTREVAARLGVTRRWVQILAEQGHLECSKTPLGRLFARKDVEAYAERRITIAAVVSGRDERTI
jgi:excisionase family DNA binding protein